MFTQWRSLLKVSIIKYWFCHCCLPWKKLQQKKTVHFVGDNRCTVGRDELWWISWYHQNRLTPQTDHKSYHKYNFLNCTDRLYNVSYFMVNRKIQIHLELNPVFWFSSRWRWIGTICDQEQVYIPLHCTCSMHTETKGSSDPILSESSVFPILAKFTKKIK